MVLKSKEWSPIVRPDDTATSFYLRVGEQANYHQSTSISQLHIANFIFIFVR